MGISSVRAWSWVWVLTVVVLASVTACARTASPEFHGARAAESVRSTVDTRDRAASASVPVWTTRLVAKSGHQFAALRIRCIGPCADAVVDRRSAADRDSDAEVRVVVEGRTLWSARCTAGAGCDRLALGVEPVVTVRVDAGTSASVELRASPGIEWRLAGVDIEWLPPTERIRGFAYSPYRDCQSPDPNRTAKPSREQIIEDLDILRHGANAIRTYSATGIQGEIPALAHQRGLAVNLGAWLDKNRAANEREIAAVIDIAKRVPVRSVIVGSEVLLRHDMTDEELIAYVGRVKTALGPSIAVTTAEIPGKLAGEEHRALRSVLDFYLIHVYAFWGKHPIQGGAQFVLDQARRFGDEMTRDDGGRAKAVVIGETGWPAHGTPNEPGYPPTSPSGQRRHLSEFVAHADAADFFYFAPFDELWKSDPVLENGVGQFWGIYDADRHNKYDSNGVLRAARPAPDVPVVAAQTSPSVSGRAQDGVTVVGNYGDVTGFAPCAAGDYEESVHALHYDDCWRPPGAPWNERAQRMQYAPADSNPKGWAGMVWLDSSDGAPVDCRKPWSTQMHARPTLSGKQRVRFSAWSDVAGTSAKFFVGGGCSGSSLQWTASRVVQGADAAGFAALGTTPRLYEIDLRGIDPAEPGLRFGAVTARSRTPKGATLYFEDVAYDDEPPATASPAPVTSGERQAAGERLIFGRRALGDGFGMGVDTSKHDHDWVTHTEEDGGYMKLQYPDGRSWGAVFVVVGGEPQPVGSRCGMDLSSYETLQVDLKAETDDAVIWIGLKDQNDPDAPVEVKRRVPLKMGWQTCRFPLSLFTSADLKHIYIPIELVIESGIHAETIGFREVRYTSQIVDGMTCQ